MILDTWVNSSLISPVFIDPESINVIDCWESESQNTPQTSSYHNGQAIADSTANGVGVCTMSSVATAIADSSANGVTGISATATAEGESTANAVGFASKKHPVSHWIFVSQASPSFVQTNNFDYWVTVSKSNPQTPVRDEPIVTVYNYVIMV